MANWFVDWLEHHRKLTACDDTAIDCLASGMDIITGSPWYADEDEMREATGRLVSSSRTPKWANEHMDALYRELREIRAARQADAERAYSRQWSDPESRPQCELCDGTTLVIVPHPRCVWQGRIVNHPVNGKFYTVGVLCDACEVGREACRREDDRVNRAKEEELRKRPRQLTISRYTSLIHGHDGIFLLRQHEKDQAELGRAGGDRYSVSFRDLVARIAGGTKPSREHVAKNKEFANEHGA